MEKVYIFNYEEMKILFDMLEFQDPITEEQKELKNKIIEVFLG